MSKSKLTHQGVRDLNQMGPKPAKTVRKDHDCCPALCCCTGNGAFCQCYEDDEDETEHHCIRPNCPIC